MNKTETAQQLRLAAEILETGHPFEACRARHGEWFRPDPMIMFEWMPPEYQIRLALATPPDGRPLHNPNGLTAEQVGAGYRLLTQDEFQKDMHLGHQEWWSVYHKHRTWVKEEAKRSRCPSGNYGTTYRIPLFVPWPTFSIATLAQDQVDLTAEQHAAVEACLQDKAPPFQLPPPPPGMRWHREDGWKKGDLPQCYRPLALNEQIQKGDEIKWTMDCDWMAMHGLVSSLAGNKGEPKRTTRPLVFTHEGKEWTYHRPGDPMPCDKYAKVEVLYADGKDCDGVLTANSLGWGLFFKPECRIIGWRYAETTKQVELRPEDVIAKLKEAIAMLETLANSKA